MTGVRLKVLDTVKGKAADRAIEFTYYAEDVPYQPSPKAIVALHGREVVACLAQADLPGGGSKFYLAGHAPMSVRAFDRQVAELMRDEAVNQQRINERFAGPPPPRRRMRTGPHVHGSDGGCATRGRNQGRSRIWWGWDDEPFPR